MITHQIICQPDKVIDVKGKFQGEYGSEDHKRFILARSLMRCKWKLGQWVRYRGIRYQITDIYENNFFVCWRGMMPLFIELYANDRQECVVAHPSELSRSRAN